MIYLYILLEINLLINEVLPKGCVNSLFTVRLALYGYQSFYNLTPTLTRPHKTYAVLGFTYPINHQLLKSPLMDSLTMNMFRFQLG